MRTLKIFYFLGFIALLSFLTWQISEAASTYPLEIQQRIEKADMQFVCKREEPRNVSTIVYLKRDENWLIRVFTKSDEELEIWLNTSVSWSPTWLWFSLATANKIYYRVNEQWRDQNDFPEEESRQLYDRLRFTGSERSFFIECFKQKMRPASQ